MIYTYVWFVNLKQNKNLIIIIHIVMIVERKKTLDKIVKEEI